MSVTPAAVTLRPFHGFLHPDEGQNVDVAAVLAHLREQRVLGSVQSLPPGPDEACDLVLLLDDVDRVQVVRDGRVRAGAPLTRFGATLADALGLELEIAGEFFDNPAHDAEWDHPDVLLCRLVDSSLPLLAHDTVSLVAGPVEGWTLVRFDQPGIDLADHGWLPHDLPAVLLSRSGSQRTVQVVTRWTDSHGHVLARSPELTPTFDGAQISDAADEVALQTLVDALGHTHLSPDSDLTDLLGGPHFATVDAWEVARALQSPMDEHWTTRVLAALGLPTLAGDVHEGRAEVPGQTRVEAGTGVRSLVETVLRYYDAPPEEVARRTPYGRLYDRVMRNRLASGAVISTEVAGAVVLLSRAVRPGQTGRARSALVAGAVLTLADATMGAALAARRFRR